MKHIIFSILGFLILFSSCEDALDLIPKDRLTPDTYFTNENEIRLYTNSFYNLIPGASALYQEGADDIVISTLEPEIMGQRTIPESGGGWNFGALRDINFYLENSYRCPDVQVRNKYDGLAKFFRAYFYFEKVKRFGDVPWYNKVLGSADPDLYKPRDSREMVMDSILNDINFSIKHLSSEKDLYKVTKWTALALKSRICLFEGTFRKYHGIEGYEHYLQESVDASEKFMNESGYSLYKSGNAPYRDLFASLNARSEEIILARSYDMGLSLVHNVQNYVNSSTMGKPGLAKKIVDSYLMSDGSRFTDVPDYQTMEFYDETQNRDPRLSQTIRTTNYSRIGSTNIIAPNLASSTTGYHLIKYSLESIYDDWNKSHSDFPIFRAAEVYLNYAEAKAELGQITQADIDKSIKPIRDRVGMPNLVLNDANANPDPFLSDPITGYSKVSGPNQGVILEIRRERTIELVMEGFRYYDIMRWKEGKIFENDFLGMYIPGPGTYDLNKNGRQDVCFYIGTRPPAFVPLFLEIGNQIYLSNGDNGNIVWHTTISRSWDENRDYLYPVPLKERILSNGVVSQNPGWNDGLDF